VYGRDEFRLGQTEQIVAAPEFQGMILKQIAPEIRFRGLKTLYHGPHGPVEDKNPPRGQLRKPFPSGNHSVSIAKNIPAGQGAAICVFLKYLLLSSESAYKINYSTGLAV
jgi:hypothetical protein